MCLSITISWCLLVWSFETVSLQSPGCPETHNIDQAGLDKIKDVCQSCPARVYILESDKSEFESFLHVPG